MRIIGTNKIINIAPLFASWDEVAVLSCLQGHMGQVWADNEDAPTVAKIVFAGFCYVAGDANSAQAREILRQIPKGFELQLNSEAWHKTAQETLADTTQKFTRFNFKRDFGMFDREKLRSHIKTLPDWYEISLIDEEMFRYLPTLNWSRGHCSQLPSFAKFQKYGAGFVALYRGEPICAASPYVYSDEGIDIQIDTVKLHRRKGIAAACAASLILECLDKAIFPVWSADCKESCYLAEKLGYQLDRESVSYEIV